MCAGADMPQAIDKRGDRAERWVSPRREYQRCLYRAQFYVWCCLRRHADCTLRDPITGRDLADNIAANRELAAIVHKALARHYISKARGMRGHFTRGQP
jgi:hypothetical protein